MRLSLRARLLAAIGVLLAGALLAFGLLFYTALSDHLSREFDNSLRVRAADVATALTPDVGEKMDIDDIRPGTLEPASVDDASKAEAYVQILDVTGHIIATSGTKLPVDRGQVRSVIAGNEILGWVGRDKRLRVVSRPVVTNTGAIVGVIQVAQSARFLDAALGEVRRLILAGIAVTLAGAALIGWLLVGRALRPITELTAAADHIVATGRLDARIAAGPADEVGTLVRRFNAMIERLDRAFQQQRQLLADTSHELRNPLTAIRANIESVEGMDASDEVLDAVGEAKDEALRMSRLVGDLLLLGQLDARDALEHAPVELAPLVERVAARARLVANGHTIDAVTSTDLRVTGDADRLHQAVWNLVENALRYTPTGGHVRIVLRRQGESAVIRVQDNGPGIPLDHQARVFERFYRVDSARSRRNGGTGLGLAIVKWVAEAHGGHVSLISRPGDGSTFEIKLPVEAAVPTRPEQPARAAPPRATTAAAG